MEFLLSLSAPLAALPPFWAGLSASIFAGVVLTGLGAAPVFVLQTIRPGLQNAMLAFAAGVMLAATFFSLLLPALDAAEAGLGNRYGAAGGVILALLIGASLMHLAHAFAPHEHFHKGRENADATRLARIWLFVMAIALHNFPEGLAVGLANASGDRAAGLGVMLGIGLQNMPEGLAVAVALRGEGYSRGKSFLVAFLSGVVEPLGGLVGAGAIVLSGALLPWALAFAAGAMLFIISSEVIPETHRTGAERGATASLFVGFAMMLFLDVTLG
ncbi:ZIP family metal transporter [Ferrovibrio sp.]|uniref:ZIP family metal transporter n=1 Tax=Ferrovibrio sp. TaxID=1917215 RepID=UPI001B6B3492|nr:ZIP family metal transporter [Ferrovibrio sp.]MBP7064885.1 ZIP family metal transporter [Ferrovibrio sp.]